MAEAGRAETLVTGDGRAMLALQRFGFTQIVVARRCAFHSKAHLYKIATEPIHSISI
jgi:hypothetical protein